MPKLYYPVKPQRLNQGFGENPAYYAKFGLQGHDGLDIWASHGTPVYAAHEGNIRFNKDSHGGEGMYLVAPGFQTVYWHLIGDTDVNFPSPIPTDGLWHPVSAGDLIGYANNTGAPYESTGDHLHFGLLLLDAHGTILNQDNGFMGRVDPMPYFNGYYASDAKTLRGYYQSLISILKTLVGVLSRK